MAVKASVTITISKYRDTDSITRYYKLQASTAAAPAVPTTLTPSGWSTSEPTYTSGSTNTLYYTDCVVFSDGTFQYTDDGNGKAVKSSSYEAAKNAYNKAQAAQDSIDNLNIGGRNYILRSSEEYILSIPQGTNKYAFRALNISDALIELDETIKTFTISFDAYSQNGGTHLQGYLRGTTSSSMDSTPDSGISTTEWKRYSITKTIKNGYTVKNIVNFYLRIEGDSTDTVYFKNIKVEVGNKPSDWTPAPEDMASQDNLNDSYNTTMSRGEQLITNGSAILKNNYNFSTFEYDGTQSFNSAGSFKRKNKNPQPAHTDEIFPVNPDKTYFVSEYLKSENGTMRFYDLLLFYDVDKKLIRSPNHMFRTGSTTELAEDLNNGDTVVHLVDASGFDETLTQDYRRGFIFWNYKNSAGYQYPPETYSQNYYRDLFEQTGINKTNNTITLKTAWDKGTIPAGTKLSQCDSGADLKYLNAYALIPTEWTRFTGVISGIDYTGTNVAKKFPPGTAFASMGWLWNYNNVDEYAWVTNVSVTEHPSSDSIVKSITNLYYASNSSTPPAKPTAHVTTNSALNKAQWNIALPTYDENYPYLYTCKEVLLNNGTYSWTTVNQTTYAEAIKTMQTELNAVQADYLKETTFTTYKREQIENDQGIKQRLSRTEVTVYGDPNNPDDPEALINHIQKVDNDINGSGGLDDRLEAAEDTIDGTGLNDYDQRVKITQRFLNVETDVESIKNIFKITGGTNLVQNSVGYFADNDNKPTMWNIAANTIYTPFGYDGDLTGITISRGRLFCAKGSVTTAPNNIVALLANKMMSISFKYKNGANATSKIKVFNGSVVYFEKTFNSAVNQWTEYTFNPDTDPVLANPSFLNTANSLQISIESTNSTNNNGFEISDLMLNYGDIKPWELSSNEVYGAMVKLSSLGIEVTATTAKTKNFMTTDGILVYQYDPQTDTIGNLITKITDNGTMTNRLESTGDIIERDLIHTMIKDSSNNNVYVEYIR